jgi:hypothetical protein
MTASEQPELSDSSGASQVPYQFGNIPLEMRARKQWVCWRLEGRPGAAKPTKVPYSPWQGGRHADVTKPDTWGTFEQATGAPLTSTDSVPWDEVHKRPLYTIAQTGFTGIGFVFSQDDDLTGIDLDDTNGDVDAYQRQIAIVGQFNSYTELSPSGAGVHIIVKGRVARGRRRNHIELYPHSRFFTMTGNAIHNVPIAERQEALEVLYGELGGGKVESDASPHFKAEVETDDVILERMFNAANGAKAKSYYSGDLLEARSTSEAALGLMNIIGFYTQNRDQMARLFRKSKFGQTKHGQNDYHLNRIINKALERREFSHADRAGVTANGREIPFGPAPSSPQPGNQEGHPVLWDAGDWDGLEPKPQIEIVPNLILAGHVNSIYAPGGNYKTLLTHQLITSVSLGVPFLGRAVRCGNALMLNCEDDLNRLHKIQRLINKHHARAMMDLTGKLFFACRAGWFGNELALFDRDGSMNVTDAYEQLKQIIIEKKIIVAVLDNLAHLFGGNENDRNQVSSALVLLERLAMETGAAIILIGHYNKSGQVSGSTAWLNQVRNVVVIEREDERSARRVIRVEKSNYLKTGTWGEFEWEDGILLPIVRDNDGSGLVDLLEEQTFLECLCTATEQKRAVSHMKGVNYYGKIFPAMPEARGRRSAAFEAAFERLLSAGKIELDKQLWKRDNRVWKYGIRAVESCTDTPAPTPRTAAHQPSAEVVGLSCTDPARTNPLYTTYIEGGGPVGPSPPSDGEEGRELDWD